jgi:galactoside O-acetyltransferase
MRLILSIPRVVLKIILVIVSNIPTFIGIRIRYYVYRKLFKRSEGMFYISQGVTIKGFKNISIGANARFQAASYVHAIDASLTIGKDFILGTNSRLDAVRGDIKIGDYCMIAPNCVLRPDNHNFERTDVPIMMQGYNIGEINMADDVWIGANSVILKDVTIGQGSIIAAGSVVTNNVKPWSIAAGNPAKIVKKNRK